MEKEKLQKYWSEFIKQLSGKISTAHLSTYFQGTAPLEVTEEGVLVMGIPNAFIKVMLEKKYGPDILNYFNSADKNIKKIEFKTIQLKKEDSAQISEILKTKEKEAVAKIKESLPVHKRYSFKNFIVGDNNELAYAASKAVAKKSGKLYNPLFIYGGVGLGKTHLLQAIANEIRSQHPDFKILYLPAETFTNDLIDAIGRKNVKKFRNKYRDHINVLIIDDIQFIEGKERTQEELFHTFNILYGAGKQIIISSDRSPIQLKMTEERLRSRFAAGMLADIGKPDFETRIAILRSKLQQKGYLVPIEVINVIAEFIDSNVRELEAVLNQVIDEAELLQTDPSLELVEKIIERLFPNKIKRNKNNLRFLDPSRIINTCSEYFSVIPEEIIGSSRKKEVTIPRHLAMFLIRDLLNLSLEKIGVIFGNRNHTTVMHAINKTKYNIKNNIEIVKAVNKIRRDLDS